MLKKIFSSACASNIYAVVSYFRASTFCLLLVLSISAVNPLIAKDTNRADAPKKTESKDPAAPAGANSAPQGKSRRGASFVDPPVGAKSTAELVQKLSDSFLKRDDVYYLSLVKAPMRTRIRMHQQFMRDCNRPTSDFKFETVAEEAARLNTTKDAVAKRTTNNGTTEEYEFPVFGFITYDSHTSLAASAPKLERPGIAVGKVKDTYFIITRQPVEVATPAAAAAPAPAAPAKAH